MASQTTKPRFPNLMKLLAIHFKEEQSTHQTQFSKFRPVRPLRQHNHKQESASSKKETKTGRRKAQIGRGFQKQLVVAAEIPDETRIEKQLRKGAEAFRDVNYFKAICCYSKVSYTTLICFITYEGYSYQRSLFTLIWSFRDYSVFNLAIGSLK